MNHKRVISLLMVFLLVVGSPLSALADDREFISEELFLEYAAEIGEMYDLSPYLLYSVAYEESRFHIHAENGLCKGLMQVSIKWHADRMEELGIDDIYDPYSNILVAADYLAELYEEKQDTAYILMRYNMMTETANRLYEEGIVSDYAKSVMGRATILELQTLKEEDRKRKEAEKLETEHEKALENHEKKLERADESMCGGVAVWLNY